MDLRRNSKRDIIEMVRIYELIKKEPKSQNIKSSKIDNKVLWNSGNSNKNIELYKVFSTEGHFWLLALFWLFFIFASFQ
jgi:hypothetical protein